MEGKIDKELHSEICKLIEVPILSVSRSLERNMFELMIDDKGNLQYHPPEEIAVLYRSFISNFMSETMNAIKHLIPDNDIDLYTAIKLKLTNYSVIAMKKEADYINNVLILYRDMPKEG